MFTRTIRPSVSTLSVQATSAHLSTCSDERPDSTHFLILTLQTGEYRDLPEAVAQTVRVTEKGSLPTGKLNRYQFVVARDANKLDVKHAIEKVFKVKVARVNTLHVRGKGRRQMTRQAGFTAAWKKAVVTLKEGHKIELA
jgi:large subunit ribosomal protein L23